MSIQARFEERSFKKIIKQFESEAVTHYDESDLKFVAGSYFYEENYAKCIDICEKIYRSFQNDIGFLSMLGAAFRRNGEYKEARRIFRLAIENDGSNDSILMNNYANLLIDEGSIEEAIKVLGELIGREITNLDDVQKNLSRAKILLELNKSKAGSTDQTTGLADPLELAFLEQEEVEFNKSVLSDADTAAIKQGLGLISEVAEQEVVQNKEALSEAVALLRNQIQIDPLKTLEDLNLLIRKCPLEKELYMIGGEANLHRKNFNDAELCFYSAYCLGSEDLSVTIALTNLSHMRGDFHMSKFWLEKSRQLCADSSILAKIENNLFSDIHYLEEKLNVFQTEM